LPFRLEGVDSDNGSEFINWHLKNWCEQKKIQLTGGRPDKKDDHAHVKQKNWTHVRNFWGGNAMIRKRRRRPSTISIVTSSVCGWTCICPW
jgi:hypothetical protein